MMKKMPELHFFEVEPLAGEQFRGGNKVYQFDNTCNGLPLSAGDKVVAACKFDKKSNINKISAIHNCTNNTRKLFGFTKANLIGELLKYWTMVLFCLLTCFVFIGALLLPFVLVIVIFFTVLLLSAYPKMKKVDQILMKLDGVTDKEEIKRMLPRSYDGVVHLSM